MQDIRLQRWAHTLVHYSLALKSGEILAIETTPAAAPLIEAVYQEALHIGVHPVPFLNLETLDERLFQEGNDQQLDWLSPMHQAMAELYLGPGTQHPHRLPGGVPSPLTSLLPTPTYPPTLPLSPPLLPPCQRSLSSMLGGGSSRKGCT